VKNIRAGAPAYFFIIVCVLLNRLCFMNKVVVMQKNHEWAKRLGCNVFKKEYGLKYAYLSGAMYRGIASKELVVAMAKSGVMGFLGVGGVPLSKVGIDIDFIQQQLSNDESFGVNLLNDLDDPAAEMLSIEMYIARGVTNIEAAAFMQVTPALVYFRLCGLRREGNRTVCGHRIIAKVSRPEVAAEYMLPAPKEMVEALLRDNKVTPEQAELAKYIPISDDICVEADSGGHTDQGVASVLLPAVQSLRDELMETHGYASRIRVGLAGGIGTPTAVAAAFMMDADFVVTGSVNQCTVEAATSDAVKDMLQGINVQDTDYAPAGDMFELGAKVQVLKKGVLFPARANKLLTLYRQYSSLEDLPNAVRKQLEEKFFKRSFDTLWVEVRDYYCSTGRKAVVDKAERLPKQKMAMIFKWYFSHSAKLALGGDVESAVDFQVHTGPALGAFNQWVKGTELEDWRNRHVAGIAELLMVEAALLMQRKFHKLDSLAT